MPRTSITLMPLADTFRVTLRPSDATKYVFFCTFGSKRRFVRRCECEMLCPKPGTAPVTWHTAAMVSFLNRYRGASAPPKVTCRHADTVNSASRGGAQRRPHFCGQPSDATRGMPHPPLSALSPASAGGCGCRAVGAHPEHVDDVVRLGEAVLGGDVTRPGLHGIRRDLHRGAAVAADQVMVVRAGRARAIQALALLHERVGLTLAREVGERAIDGGEPDLRAGAAQGGVQRLRRHETLGAAERVTHGLTLPGVALHGATTSFAPRVRRSR